MDKIKFLTTDNAVQKVYSELGILVPAGALSGTTKAPSVKIVSTSTTQTSITATINIGSGADLTTISYELWDTEGSDSQDPEPTAYGDLTVQKGTQTFTIDNLELGSGPYELNIYAENENGSQDATIEVSLQEYINWASADEILANNKAVSDGEEVVGTIATKDSSDVTLDNGVVTVPAGYYAEDVTLSTGTYANVLIIGSSYCSPYNDYTVNEGEDPIYIFNGEQITESEFNALYDSSDYQLKTADPYEIAIPDGYDGIGHIDYAYYVVYCG